MTFHNIWLHTVSFFYRRLLILFFGFVTVTLILQLLCCNQFLWCRLCFWKEKSLPFTILKKIQKEGEQYFESVS